MKHLIRKIIAQLINKQSFIADYPKPGVTFLTLDALFKDPVSRKIVADAVIFAIKTESFDAVASIASRGYIFSGIITNRFADIGEHFIQKVKAKGDAHYIQTESKTEYSSDALQVLKNTIEKGKKYLLTDDLIATGGSVVAAIQLIRECGGEVDTVFVMTELLEFGARERLQKEGVNLVSLLSFTRQDLDKLLLLQKCYHDNPSTPMTYQLSRHAQGDMTLMRSSNTSKLTIQLASQSSEKKEAAQLAFQGMFDPLSIEVIGHDAESGVNCQPSEYEETRQGAGNRLKSITDNMLISDNTILVSMENGIRYSEAEKTYYDFVHVIVKKGEKTFSHTQDCCKVPAEVVNAISKDKDGHFQETWGDAALKMQLTRQPANPHQEACFGGISRTEHLRHALCKTLGKLKENMLEHSTPEMDDQQFNIKRLVDINVNKIKRKLNKKGVFFAESLQLFTGKRIDLYNQGCSKDAWGIKKEQIKQNEFKIFPTGDAFSILAADVKVEKANITIHVGVEHEKYSPLVLLHEALQQCRCVHEHGAWEITIALPEQFHPVLHANDFNQVLMKLFKASGANRIYYYDKHYKGSLNAANSKALIPLTLSQQADSEHYQISRSDLQNYINLTKDSQTLDSLSSIDAQVMHFTRRANFQKIWSRFALDDTNIVENLCGSDTPSGIQLPAMKNRPHVLLCCSANQPFADKIADSLRLSGEEVRVYTISGNGDLAVIPPEAELSGAVVTIMQSTRPNPDNTNDSQEYHTNGASAYLFETIMVARQAELRGAGKINLINPYQFSARSDKAEKNHKGKTGAYVQHNGRLLEAVGVNHVFTAEPHDAHTMAGSFTGKTIQGTALTALSIIATRIAQDWIDHPDHSTQGRLRLVTPDAGATKRTKELTAELQFIVGDKLCEARILGEKERDSHKDDSASLESLNSGTIGINANDKYIITDDETATGSTLCQAITNLTQSGANDIAVIIVHNNMPLDWLSRQMCLARFLYMGVNDLHFSDTQEMGTLAASYQDLIHTLSRESLLPEHAVEQQVFTWFKENISKHFADKSDEHLHQEFARFQSMFNHFQTKIKIHSLADEFAQQVSTKLNGEELALDDYQAEPALPPSTTEESYVAKQGALLFFGRQPGKQAVNRDALENNQAHFASSRYGMNN